MKKLYDGGQCNPNAIGATSNQYKRMMNQVGMGNQNAERVINFNQQGMNFEDEIMQRQAMFKQMDQAYNASTKQVNMEQVAMRNQMNKQFQNARMQEMEMQRKMMMMQDIHWKNTEIQMQKQQQMMRRQFQQATLRQQAENWKNEMKMDKQYQQAKITYEQQQKNIHDSTASMLDVMMNDPDPRFQNSQFLGFLKRIEKGQIIIEGKQLKQVKPEQNMMENAWNTSQKNYMIMDQQFRKAQQEQMLNEGKQLEKLQNLWQNKQKQYGQMTTEEYDKMMEQKYRQVLSEMNIDWDKQFGQMLQRQKGQYVFNRNNPYLDVAFPKKLAYQLINKGKNNESILALEAHLQKNLEDSESWRILGRLLQENDQDDESKSCFIQSLKANPQNLDSLLSLGFSSSNSYDDVQALNCLKKWLILNPNYAYLHVDPNLISDEKTSVYDYSLQQQKQIINILLKHYNDALTKGSKDPQLWNALALLNFINKDYQNALQCFKRVVDLDPTNYLVLNKIGASLALAGKNEEAIEYYHKALDLRPNYVRVWVNIALAHVHKGMLNEASRFYLNALSFRPDAKHIWDYLRTNFMRQQRYDLVNLISREDPRLFKQFDVISLEDLPEPQVPYSVTTQRHILNKQAKQWLSEIQKK